tara:strand:- start:47 stop:763 length:717 start_codon:yes stop_codon:yes gene_type:complete
MSLSIVMPVRNEEEIILKTLEKFNNSWLTQIDHEIIIINDNSSDETTKLIKNNKFKKINVILKDNYKKDLGSAIITGIDNSSKKYLSIYMADMSDSLDDLNSYYNKIKNDDTLDAVFGSRFIKGSEVTNYPKIKFFLNRFSNNLIKIIFFSKYNDFTNAFKIYKKSTLLKLYPLVSENFNVFLEIPLKIECRRLKYKIIPISWKGRTLGKSKFRIKEIGSKYIFTMLYCLLEKILLKK